MIRTQIQLPDEVYHRAKKICKFREVSLAEMTRRGLEYMLSVYSPPAEEEWVPPQPIRMGWRDLTDEQLKEAAQVGILPDHEGTDR